MAVFAEGRRAFAGHRRNGFAGRQAPADLGQGQRRPRWRQPRRHAAQGEVGRETGQARLVERQPGTHRALALVQFERVIEIRLPGGQVGIAQVGVQLALPQRDGSAAGGKARTRKIGAHVQRRRQRGRRRGAQGEAVAIPAVGQGQLDLLERQGGRFSLQVGPVDMALADDDVMLAQGPVVGRPALFIVEHDAGHRQAAGGIAPHVQAGADQLERLEAGVAGQQGPPGKGRRHARQGERGAALGVAQHHVAQEQVGPQALPGSIDAGDRHLVAERAAGHPLDIALVIVDVRQDGIAQQQEQDGEGEIHQQGEAHRPAENMVGGLIA